MTGSIPVSFYRKAFAFLSVVCFAGLSFAADVATWTDAYGDHRWDNAANWDLNAVPNSSNEIHIPTGTWTINIGSGELKYGPLIIDEGSGSVTFTGSGTLKRSDYADLSIGAGREMIVDGCTFLVGDSLKWDGATLRVRSGEVRLDETATLGGTCRVCVEGGMFGGTGKKDLSITNSASLIISGGLVHLRSYKVYGSDVPGESGGLIRLTGGTLHNDDAWSCYRTQIYGGRFENLGGTVLWGNSSKGSDRGYNRLSSESGDYGEGETFALFLPQVGGELVIPTCTTYEYGAMKFHYSNRNYDFGGTVYATNNCNEAGVLDAAAGTVYFYGEDEGTLSIRGGATVCANTLKIYAKKTFTNNLDLTRLNLGIGGIRRNEEYGGPSYQYFNFLDGIEFGAWGGDVARSGAARSRLLVRPQGPVVFDTKDCFDHTTPRTINMDCIRLDDVSDLKATGGGTVALYPGATWTGEFRTLEVSDNTTLAFCTNNLADWESRSSYISGVKAMNLKLGANAKVKINMSFGDYVDASSTAEFGEGAKIVVADLPATLTEGMFYPVYFAPAGTEADLSKIEYAEGEWPTGWYLAKRGCAVYLTDGNESVYSDPNNKWSWSGGGSDNVYTNLDNWGGKEGSNCNTTGGADIYFNGAKTLMSTLTTRAWYSAGGCSAQTQGLLCSMESSSGSNIPIASPIFGLSQ